MDLQSLDIRVLSTDDLSVGDTQSLSEAYRNDSHITFTKPPTLIKRKGDLSPEIVLSVALLSSTIPTLASLLMDWIKTRKTEELEVEVANGDKKIHLKIRKGQEDTAMELANKIMQLL
jgi:hypothetical protein